MGTFHSFICMAESLGCIAGFITGVARYDIWEPMWYVSILMFFLFPFVNEAFMILKGKSCRSSVRNIPDYLKDGAEIYKTLPIVYSSRYNIHCFGIEKFHPFDAAKYRRVWEFITAPGGCLDLKKYRVHRPAVPSRQFL